jgi:hypothetical protein
MEAKLFIDNSESEFPVQSPGIVSVCTLEQTRTLDRVQFAIVSIPHLTQGTATMAKRQERTNEMTSQTVWLIANPDDGRFVTTTNTDSRSGKVTVKTCYDDSRAWMFHSAEMGREVFMTISPKRYPGFVLVKRQTIQSIEMELTDE